VRFIEQFRRGQPFLLSLHFTAPHWPWETRTDFIIAFEALHLT